LLAAVALLGFLTFGEACSGLVLNNYSTKDTLASLSSPAISLADGFLDLAPAKKRSNSMLNVLMVVLLAVLTILANQVRDLRHLVLSFWGAS